MDGGLTLEELAAAVAAELDRLRIVPADGRAAERPDARTLRYYTSIGLLDPPLERRNRRAIYGPRHVRQAVAVKRLQADGVPLAAIQQRLAGLDDGSLGRLAARRTAPVHRAGRAHFWTGGTATAAAAPLPAARPAARGRITGVELTPGVTVLVRGDAAWITDPRVSAALDELAAAIDATRSHPSGDDDDPD